MKSTVKLKLPFLIHPNGSMNQTKQGIKPHGLFWFPLQLHSVDITCENIQIYTSLNNSTQHHISPTPTKDKTQTNTLTHTHTHIHTRKKKHLFPPQGLFWKKGCVQGGMLLPLRFAMLLTSCISCFQSLNWGQRPFRPVVGLRSVTNVSPVAITRWKSLFRQGALKLHALLRM